MQITSRQDTLCTITNTVCAAFLPEQPLPRQNRLLAALPAADYERLAPHLGLVMMPLGWTVHESGDAQSEAYFPATSIVSHLYVTDQGSSTQIALVGNEGAVGLAVFMGGGSAPGRATVYGAGYAYRLTSSVLKAEFSRGGSLQQLLLRYTQALMTQVMQTAVCNRHHAVEQQLCRLLLVSLDRSSSNKLTLSHELAAAMLGVRREAITGAAGRLRAAGLIRYSRGRIGVLDRTKLEARVCECYAVVKREYDRLLPQAPRPSARNPSEVPSVSDRHGLPSGSRASDPVAQV